jgi:uncharacterized membrane protein
MSKTLTSSVAVERNAEHPYKRWSHMQDFPKFMSHIKTAVPTMYLASHWVMKGSMGRSIEWDARVTESEANRRIAWETLRGDFWMTGEISLKSLGKGRTEVTVSIQYNPNEGIIGKVGGMLADPQGDLEADLHRFKAYAGGIPVHLM